MSLLYALYSARAASKIFLTSGFLSIDALAAFKSAGVKSSPKCNAANPLSSARIADMYIVNKRFTASPLPTSGVACFKMPTVLAILAPPPASMMRSMLPSLRVFSIICNAPLPTA